MWEIRVFIVNDFPDVSAVVPGLCRNYFASVSGLSRLRSACIPGLFRLRSAFVSPFRLEIKREGR